jgi:hypothetical protein
MATTKPVCAPAWYTDPKVLVTDSWITEWKRRATGRPLCFSERINAITRTFLAIIVIATLFSFYNQDLQTTMTYSLVLGLIITLPDIIDMIRAPYIQEPEYQTVDGFRSPDMMEYTNVTSKINGLTDASNCVAPISPPPLPQSSNCDVEDDSMTMPSPRNPFMNVLIDEIKYNPKRPQAAPVDSPIVKQTLDEYFRVQWFSDPTDVFGKSQSQRQFITMPSTTVPKDRDSFQNWLYKIPGKTCKEGGRAACVGGTDGAAVPWLNL